MDQDELLDVKNIGQSQSNPLGICGFVLSLIGLVFSVYIAGISMVDMISGGSGWLAYGWVLICVFSVALSTAGMYKANKTGKKKGLAIAGLVIGVVAVIVSLLLLFAVIKAGKSMRDFTETIENLDDFNKN